MDLMQHNPIEHRFDAANLSRRPCGLEFTLQLRHLGHRVPPLQRGASSEMLQRRNDARFQGATVQGRLCLGDTQLPTQALHLRPSLVARRLRGPPLPRYES